MKIVTISRQVGSLGDVIAAIVARKLDLKLIGRDQVHERANVCDPEYSDACSAYETERGPGFFERIFFDSPSYTSLFESLTYEFASQGDVVISGRGSQLILKNIPGVFHARIVAPTEMRVERIKERFGIDGREATNYVRRHDRERRALMQSMFDKNLSDWSLYDVVLNTAHYDAEGASEVVRQAVVAMQALPEQEGLKEKLAAMAMAKSLETIIKKRLSAGIASHLQADGEPGGKIILSGRMRDKKSKDQAESIAKGYPGVSEVVNDIKLTDLAFSY